LFKKTEPRRVKLPLIPQRDNAPYEHFRTVIRTAIQVGLFISTILLVSSYYNQDAFQCTMAFVMFFITAVFVPVTGGFSLLMDVRSYQEVDKVTKVVNRLSYRIDSAVQKISPGHTVEVPDELVIQDNKNLLAEKKENKDPFAPAKAWLVCLGLPLALVGALFVAAFLCKKDMLVTQASSNHFRAYFTAFVGTACGLYALWGVAFPGKAVKATDKFMSTIIQTDRFWKYLFADDKVCLDATGNKTETDILDIVFNDADVISPKAVQVMAAKQHMRDVTNNHLENLDEEVSNTEKSMGILVPPEGLKSVRRPAKYADFRQVVTAQDDEIVVSQQKYSRELFADIVKVYISAPTFVPYYNSEIRSTQAFLEWMKRQAEDDEGRARIINTLEAASKLCDNGLRDLEVLYDNAHDPKVGQNGVIEENDKGKAHELTRIELMILQAMLLVTQSIRVQPLKASEAEKSLLPQLKLFKIALGDEAVRVVGLTRNDAMKIYSCSGDCSISPTNTEMILHVCKLVKQKYLSKDALCEYMPVLMVLLLISAIVWNTTDYLTTPKRDVVPTREQTWKSRIEARTKGQNIKIASANREQLAFNDEEQKQHWDRIVAQRDNLRLAQEEILEHIEDIKSHGTEWDKFQADLDLASVVTQMRLVDVQVEKLYNGDVGDAIKVRRAGKGKNKLHEALAGCFHTDTCPKKIQSNWKENCHQICGGHHCMHFSGCSPAVTVAEPVLVTVPIPVQVVTETKIPAITAPLAERLVDAGIPQKVFLVSELYVKKSGSGKPVKKLNEAIVVECRTQVEQEVRVERQKIRGAMYVVQQKKRLEKAELVKGKKAAESIPKVLPTSIETGPVREALSLIPQPKGISAMHKSVVPIYSRSGDEKTKLWSVLVRARLDKKPVWVMKNHSWLHDAYIKIDDKEFKLPSKDHWKNIGEDNIVLDDAEMAIPGVPILGPLKQLQDGNEVGFTMYSYEPSSLAPVMVSGLGRMSENRFEHVSTTFNFQCGSPYVNGENHIVGLHGGAIPKVCNYGHTFDLKASAKQ
jgi:hypothetical protein